MLEVFADLPLLIDDAGEIHLGQGVDHARAADADGLDSADDFVSRLQRLRVDGHGFDGTLHGPHAVLDTAPLEAGTGGACSSHHPVLVPQHDLAVGTYIDKDTDLFPLVNLCLRMRPRRGPSKGGSAR